MIQKLVLAFATLIVLCACNLSAPGSAVDDSTTGSASGNNANIATPDYPTPAAAQTDWVTYENTTQQYEIQRPASLSFIENANEIVIDDQISVHVSDINPEEALGGGTVIEKANDVMIWQYPGRELQGYVGAIGGNVPHSIEQVVIPHNGKFYVLTVTEIKRSSIAGNGRDIRLQGPIPAEALELFNSILTTFRFTDQ